MSPARSIGAFSPNLAKLGHSIWTDLYPGFDTTCRKCGSSLFYAL